MLQLPSPANNIVRFARQNNASGTTGSTLQKETRKFVVEALQQRSPSEKPKSPEREIRLAIAGLPENQIKALLSDVPVRRKDEGLFSYLGRAFPTYYELREKILKNYNLEALDLPTQKKLAHFFRKVDTLKKLLNKNLEKLVLM